MGQDFRRDTMGNARRRELISRSDGHRVRPCPVQSAVLDRPRHCTSPLATSKLHRTPFSRRPRSSGASLWRDCPIFDQRADNLVCERSTGLIDLAVVHTAVSGSRALQRTMASLPSRHFATSTRRGRRRPTSLPPRASDGNAAAREPAATRPGGGGGLGGGLGCRGSMPTARGWPPADVSLGTRSCQRQPCARVGSVQRRLLCSSSPVRFRLGYVTLIHAISRPRQHGSEHLTDSDF
mmetsp:Transcript_32087/g.83190  ORF Transcript_32087/g.83190 Transcript_32087/m.83190 type:complete len:237 (-) Transcript_32087:13-723(-)